MTLTVTLCNPLILVLCLLLLILTSRQISTTPEQSYLSDNDLYKITWMGPLASTSDINEANVIQLHTKDHHQYKCVVPDGYDQTNFDASIRNASTTGQNQKSGSPIHLLEPFFRNEFCSYKYDLFWVYELCHGRFLRQYHGEPYQGGTKITQEYFLGKFDLDKLEDYVTEYEEKKSRLEEAGEAWPTINIDGHVKPYIMFNMTGGTKCDLTKKDRVSKIIYACNDEPKNEIISIKEVATCEYEAIILTPFLCLHKDFRHNVNTQLEIQCYSVADSPEKPPNVIDVKEGIDNIEHTRLADKKRGVAYFQGRTLIIDADLLTG